MTFFIDISGHQLGLDIVLAREAGNEAVIVKAVAAYLPQHTVADGYHSHIDGTIRAGLPKGHYLVPNSQNTPKQSAAFFAANLYRRAPGDVFMLDNEPLDTYKTFWRDDQVMEFFEEFVRLTGVSWSQLWLYCPAALTRASGPWTRVEEARKTRGLKIVWVSYGDNDPYREDGEEPLLGGGITGWDVHQFTSTYRVPGYGGNLDRNYSPHTVGELFRDGEGDAMTTEEHNWLRNVYQAIFFGGESMEDGKQSISRSLAQINEKTLTLSEAQIEAIAASVAAKVPGADAGAIASAVRAEFSENPLR